MKLYCFNKKEVKTEIRALEGRVFQKDITIIKRVAALSSIVAIYSFKRSEGMNLFNKKPVQGVEYMQNEVAALKAYIAYLVYDKCCGVIPRQEGSSVSIKKEDLQWANENLQLHLSEIDEDWIVVTVNEKGDGGNGSENRQ